MRASATFGSLTALAVLTALAPLGAATARADAPADWRAAACEEDNHGDHALGSYTVTRTLSQRLEEVPSLTVTAERLVFASGTHCDLLQLDGRVPFGRELRGHGSELTVLGQMVVGGASQGEMAGASSGTGYVGSTPIREADHLVLGTVVYTADESGTMPNHLWLPEPWRNQPYTFTHTRTTFTATVNGRVGTRKTFTVTPATRAAAKRRLTRDLAIAQTAVDRQAARKTYRLALRGVKLVMKRFKAEWSGELPR